MTTRISKIARLPAKIREQLNLRLHNGDLGRTILPWVNNLPKTKKVLADLFAGNPITHQNLSEWRATGYQDWLMQQERKHWFRNLNEQNTELDKHDQCCDTYEAMSRFFLYALGQSLEAAQKIKNPDTRCARIETLTDKFSRLQNAYNWSRRVQLEFDKYNNTFEPDQPDEPETIDCTVEDGEHARPGRSEPRPRGSHLGSDSPNDSAPSGINPPTPVPQTFLPAGSRAFPVPCSDPAPLGPPASRRPEPITEPVAAAPVTAPKSTEPKRERAGALQAAPRSSEIEDRCASLALAETPFDSNSSTPKLINSQTPEPFVPIPTPSLTTQNPAIPTWKNHKVHSIPIRGRRFTCIEG
jgi:hypothetical protein